MRLGWIQETETRLDGRLLAIAQLFHDRLGHGMSDAYASLPYF